MLVLALDTTTRTGSCALACDGVILREQASDPALAPASRLPRELMELLAAADVSLAHIDAYAVATGPGSFTGLRVGIATMQGLAFAAGKPLVGVSGFDALYHAVRSGNAVRAPARLDAEDPAGAAVAAWIDAWRGEVYAAVYENGRQVEPPVVAAPPQLLERRRGRRTVFVGEGAAVYRATIAAALGEGAVFADPVAPLLAGAIAQIATSAVWRGDAPPPHAIRPLYVRRPDPEIARDAGLGR